MSKLLVVLFGGLTLFSALGLGAKKQPPPTPIPVTVTNPIDGQVIDTSQVIISTTIADSVPLTQVVIYIDGAVVFFGNQAPFQFRWNINQATYGNHTIFATALDEQGNTGTSPHVIVLIPFPNAK